MHETSPFTLLACPAFPWTVSPTDSTPSLTCYVWKSFLTLCRNPLSQLLHPQMYILPPGQHRTYRPTPSLYCVLSRSAAWTPWDCGPPGSSGHGDSRQESWSGWPSPSPDSSSTTSCCEISSLQKS